MLVILTLAMVYNPLAESLNTVLMKNTRTRDTLMDFLKVSSKSSPASVAGAIAGLIKDGNPVRIQSIGAGAVNQAVKAIAIARGYLAPSGIDVACVPSFVELEINGDTRTGIRFAVHPHYSDDFAEVEETVDEAALV